MDSPTPPPSPPTKPTQDASAASKSATSQDCVTNTDCLCLEASIPPELKGGVTSDELEMREEDQDMRLCQMSNPPHATDATN
jgi:hypothetical protein